MQFDTPAYIAFLAVVVFLYWRLRLRGQNILLLAASYFFYGWWDWRFLGLIGISTSADYFCARWIAASSSPTRRRQVMLASVALNLAFLGVFKYFNFFVDSLVSVLSALSIGPIGITTIRIALPPAISFYTFQEIAYIVDVYRGKMPASRSIIEYGLFVSLFPHLIAGPIQKPLHLLPQIQQPREFRWRQVFDGVVLIISGLFRKCVIADNCALIADAAFDGRLGQPNVWVLVLGAYAFAWQIYGDFSGYSDIARGSAKVIGFEFMVNFRQPYLSWSLQEFWRRWHISLSNWLRDYVFLPLSFSASRRLENCSSSWCRSDQLLYAVAAIGTMTLAGLWHGASWSFVAWGLYFGLLLATERLVWSRVRVRRNPLRTKNWPLFSVPGWLMRILVFNLVAASWVLFRAGSLESALAMFSGLADWTWRPIYAAAVVFLGFFATLSLVIDVSNELRAEEYPCQTAGVVAPVGLVAALLLALAVSAANDANTFVYFQF